MILPISEGGFFDARNVDGKLCIGYTSLRKYMPKYIKPTSKINTIACGWETFISAMLIQSDINNGGYKNLPNLMSYILIMHQLEFYKYIRYS